MKTKQLIRKSLARAAIALGLGLGVLGSTQAGVVTGVIDPPFGAVLPGVSYAYNFSFSVADSCLGNSEGEITVNLGSPGCPVVPVNIDFRIYATGTPAVFQNKLLSLNVLQMTVVDGFVMGITTNLGSTFFNDFAGGPFAPGKLFNFAQLGYHFMPYIMVGQSCGVGCVALDGVADTVGAVATIYNYDDQYVSALGYDTSGAPIGYRITRSLDAEGSPVDTVERTGVSPNNQVPEPASIALALTALLGLGFASKARKRG